MGRKILSSTDASTRVMHEARRSEGREVKIPSGTDASIHGMHQAWSGQTQVQAGTRMSLMLQRNDYNYRLMMLLEGRQGSTTRP
jgi:hypothetical protein